MTPALWAVLVAAFLASTVEFVEAFHHRAGHWRHDQLAELIGWNTGRRWRLT